MTSPPTPRSFRVIALLLLASTVVGQWWQHQPVGPRGAAFLALAARHCPVAADAGRHPTVADTADTLDRWAFARLIDLTLRDHRDRCRR